MERLIDLVKKYKINNNLEPVKTVILSTGVKCHHYKSGLIIIE